MARSQPDARRDHVAHLQEVVRELKTIDPSLRYYAITLLADDGRIIRNVQTTFEGWADGGPESGREIRKACEVIPDKMTKLWENVEETWVCVKNATHLALFLRMGGNALVEQGVAHEHLEDLVSPRVTAKPGPLGFVWANEEDHEFRNKRPTKRQRSRIMKRDGYRCQLCGERPSENEHVTLHVHHVRSFSKGGLTTDENLITLCHTCHEGLDPHSDETLYYLPGGLLDAALRERSAERFRAGVEEYRAMAASILGRIA